MPHNSHEPPERLPGRNWLKSFVHYAGCRGVRGSVVIALALLFWDAVFTGSYTLSLLACPVWFVLSAAKSFETRPGWRLAVLRIAFPVVTLLLVLINDAIQKTIAEARAEAIIAACEEFHAANGRYPHTLKELVPKYMPTVPRAKYCMTFSEFLYAPQSPMLFGTPFHPSARAFTTLDSGGGVTWSKTVASFFRQGDFLQNTGELSVPAR